LGEKEKARRNSIEEIVQAKEILSEGNSIMARVLIGCEESAVIRDTFLKRGHDAWSCDLQPSRGRAGNHIIGDILDVLRYGWFDGYDIRSGKQGRFYRQWDLFIVHPPCTYLSVSGLHWNKRRPEREQQTKEALEFVRQVWTLAAPIPHVCMENPVSCISTRLDLPKPQIIQPYQFGHDASKKTCLWLRGLPQLVADPAKYIKPRMVCGVCGTNFKYEERDCPACGSEAALAKPRWSNQTDSGQNKLPPSKDRGAIRAVTYQGIADAMADQWGRVNLEPREIVTYEQAAL
jgi:hypothetical protein